MEQQRAAREIVLRALSVQARSRAQLRTKLDSKGIPPEVSEQVLDRFTEVGLVDDAAYAESIVRNRGSRGLSRRGLQEEMRRRGVPKEIAAEAVAEVSDESEYDSALRLALKKVAATQGLEPAVRERRIVAMLGRKGYGGSVTYRAVREALGEVSAEHGDF